MTPRRTAMTAITISPTAPLTPKAMRQSPQPASASMQIGAMALPA